MDERRLINGCDFEKMTTDKILELAAEQLIKDILEACSSDILFDKKIECLLLEYGMQTPLPVTLAFIQTHEVQSASNEYPLAWLNAPDAELFSEEEPKFKTFAYKSHLIYEVANSRIESILESEYNSDISQEEVEQDGSIRLMFDFYVRICKELHSKILQLDGLSLAKDFFVVAKDFEACNELDHLRAVLPESRFKPIQDAFDEYERKTDEYVNEYLKKHSSNNKNK
jgi:hypothetical protein